MSELPLLFATEAYEPLASQLVALGVAEAGAVERKRFPDGERYRRLMQAVGERRVVLLGGTIGEEDTLELYDLGCAVVKYGASSLMLLVPYFGYATMERAVKPGEVVAAKTRARLLSAIPPAAEMNHVVLLDLHAEGIPHYFEGGVRATHRYAKGLVAEAIRELLPEGGVVACTDAGRAKWVESLANDLGLPAAFVLKRRIDGARTELTAVSAQVEGQDVVIYDDMIRTGGSLLEAAKAYHAAGARRVSAVTTHGVFPEGALARLQGSGLLDAVVSTDSHPRAVEAAAAAPDFLRIKPIAGLLAEAIAEAWVGR